MLDRERLLELFRDLAGELDAEGVHCIEPGRGRWSPASPLGEHLLLSPWLAPGPARPQTEDQLATDRPGSGWRPDRGPGVEVRGHPTVADHRAPSRSTTAYQPLGGDDLGSRRVGEDARPQPAVEGGATLEGLPAARAYLAPAILGRGIEFLLGEGWDEHPVAEDGSRRPVVPVSGHQVGDRHTDGGSRRKRSVFIVTHRHFPPVADGPPVDEHGEKV